MSKGMPSANYFTIAGFMCNELGLKGNDLLIYAIIRGFSMDGVSRFTGGRDYLAKTLNINKQTVDNSLKYLCDTQCLVVKVDTSKNDQKFYEYYVDLDEEKRILEYFESDSLKNRLPPPKNLAIDSLKNRPNNIDDNIDENIDLKKNVKKKFDPIAFLDSVDFIRDNQELKTAWVGFIEMRNAIHKPIKTEHGLKLLINDAWKHGHGDPQTMIAVINQSTAASYQGIFALKTNQITPRTAAPVKKANDTMAILDALYAEALAEETAKEAAT